MLPHFFAALSVLANPLRPAVSTVQLALPASEGTAAATSGQLDPPAVADGSYSNVTSKDRPPEYAAASPGRAASGKERGVVPLQRKEPVRGAATTSKATPGRAAKTAVGTGTETTDKLATATAGQRTPYGSGTAGRPAQSKEEAGEPSARKAPALSVEKKVFESGDRTPRATAPAGGIIRGGPPLGRRSSASATLVRTYPAPPTQKAVTAFDQPTATLTTDKTTYLSPLAAAALKRATSSSVTPPAPPPTPSDRLSTRFSSGRSAAFIRGGTAALERAARAVAARVGKGESRTASSTVSSQSMRTASKPMPSGAKPSSTAGGGAEATGASTAGAAATEGGPATASPKPSVTATSSSAPSSAASAATSAPGLDPTAAVAAALLTGTVRRLAFERCDRYIQKVTITASPGDTIIVECPGAARTIPPDIETLCCKGSCARCTTKSAVRYDTLFRIGSIPNFRYAANDGINMPWRLKIPESLQPPYPKLSVAWVGPAILSIPIEASAGATGIPVSTLVIHIEPRREPEDRLALLRSPGAAGECPPEEEPPKKEEEKEEEETLLDEEDDEYYGILYERTPFGMRRVSHADVTARPFCPVHFIVSYGGSIMKSLLPLLERLCYIPWIAIFSVTFTGTAGF